MEKYYRHRLTGERLRIKRITGNVAACWIENPYYNDKWMFRVDVCICLLENLEEEKTESQQLKIAI